MLNLNFANTNESRFTKFNARQRLPSIVLIIHCKGVDNGGGGGGGGRGLRRLRGLKPPPPDF